MIPLGGEGSAVDDSFAGSDGLKHRGKHGFRRLNGGEHAVRGGTCTNHLCSSTRTTVIIVSLFQEVSCNGSSNRKKGTRGGPRDRRTSPGEAATVTRLPNSALSASHLAAPRFHITTLRPA